jgi:hypothetical protein
MSGSVLKNIRPFMALFGQKATPNIVIATTMWSEASREIAERREAELQRVIRKDNVLNGCRTERFGDSYKSVWDIIGSLPDQQSAQVRPHETVGVSAKPDETQGDIEERRSHSKTDGTSTDFGNKWIDQWLFSDSVEPGPDGNRHENSPD